MKGKSKIVKNRIEEVNVVEAPKVTTALDSNTRQKKTKNVQVKD